MLEEILEDYVNRISASNQPIFSLEQDYAALLQKKNEALNEWKLLSRQEQQAIGGLKAFENLKEIPDLKSDELIPSKNTYLLMNEIRKRLEKQDILNLIYIESLDFDDATIELAESLENINEIRELYRIRKVSVGHSENAGITADEAKRLKNCLSQGHELFISGRNG